MVTLFYQTAIDHVYFYEIEFAKLIIRYRRHKCVSGKRLRIYEEKSQRIRHAILRASRYKEISHSILQSFHPTNKNKQADRQVHPTAFIQIKQAHPRHRM